MYLQDKRPGADPPGRAAVEPQALVTNETSSTQEPQSVTTSESAMAELNLLAQLMGEAVEQEDDGIPAFKLSMFNEAEATTQDVDYGAGTEVESMKLTVKTNRKQANKELGDIMSGFDGAAQGEQDGDDEDDLLSLMDNA
eukprot:TRINITY_DN23559_c0_g1_i3.p1 TRINITY_DN23559_c0_g1~~TRINITY_DN23559_c0_g1_i3.p1  ORF type:complete len:140 (+),score=35.87 TRINITY_DN23559_c0_g1_i3:381-800(+)